MPVIPVSGGYTVDDLIDDTLKHLTGTSRTELVVLSGDLTDAATTVTFDAVPEGVTRTSVIQVGLELMYVRSVSGTTATVIRGFRNTTAAAHDSGAIVEIDPRFPRAFVQKALLDEIRSWPPDLFGVQTVEFDTDVRENGIDLDGYENISHVLEVYLSPESGDVYKTWTRVPRWRLDRNANTDDFPSGFALMVDLDGAPFFGGYGFSSVRSVRIVAAVKFTVDPFDPAVDVETGVGLNTVMFDIPPMGAASRLMVSKEVVRSNLDVQGQARRAEEVPPGYSTQVSANLRRMADTRISQERMRLRRDYPIKGI